MQGIEENAVRRAVTAVGGVTKAAIACRVSGKAVYQWLELGHVPRTHYAKRLAEASGIPIEEFAARDDTAA